MTALHPFRIPLFAAAALAAVLIAPSAAAATAAPTAKSETTRIVVNYADLDLDTDQGAAALQRRLVAAARRACGTPDLRELRQSRQARDCAESAIGRAVEEIGSPRLAKWNAARGRSLRG